MYCVFHSLSLSLPVCVRSLLALRVFVQQNHPTPFPGILHLQHVEGLANDNADTAGRGTSHCSTKLFPLEGGEKSRAVAPEIRRRHAQVPWCSLILSLAEPHGYPEKRLRRRPTAAQVKLPAITLDESEFIQVLQRSAYVSVYSMLYDLCFYYTAVIEARRRLF